LRDNGLASVALLAGGGCVATPARAVAGRVTGRRRDRVVALRCGLRDQLAVRHVRTWVESVSSRLETLRFDLRTGACSVSQGLRPPDDIHASPASEFGTALVYLARASVLLAPVSINGAASIAVSCVTTSTQSPAAHEGQ
jgi:hypothetical protein